jgi:hypothetical protein
MESQERPPPYPVDYGKRKALKPSGSGTISNWIAIAIVVVLVGSSCLSLRFLLDWLLVSIPQWFGSHWNFKG